MEYIPMNNITPTGTSPADQAATNALPSDACGLNKRASDPKNRIVELTVDECICVQKEGFAAVEFDTYEAAIEYFNLMIECSHN